MFSLANQNTQVGLTRVGPDVLQDIPKISLAGEMTVHKLVRVATQGLSFAYIYKTLETKQQLMGRLQRTLKAVFNNEITRAGELVTESIRAFNCKFNQILGTENDKPYISLLVNFKGQLFPLKVRIEKIALQAGDEGFLIHNRHLRRYLLFDCYINGKQRYLYFSEKQVQQKPIITEAGLKRSNNYLIVKVFEARRYEPDENAEETEEQEENEEHEEWEFFETNYRFMKFQFYKNGSFMHETRNRYLPLLKNYEGMYTCIVTVYDDDKVIIKEL